MFEFSGFDVGGLFEMNLHVSGNFNSLLSTPGQHGVQLIPGTWTMTATPEPTSFILLGLGMACLAAYNWQRWKHLARSKVSLSPATTHHPIGVIGTSQGCLPSDRYQAAEENLQCSGAQTNPLRQGFR
jgi:hypothetical protein